MMTRSFNKAWAGFLAGCLSPATSRYPPYVVLALAENPRPTKPYFFDFAQAIQHATFSADKRATADSANKGERAILTYDGTGRIRMSWRRPDRVTIVFEVVDFGDGWEPVQFAVDAIAYRPQVMDRVGKEDQVVKSIVMTMTETEE